MQKTVTSGTGVKLQGVEAVVLAMDDIEAKLIATRMLREHGFEGTIVSHALHADHVDMIHDAGADQTYLSLKEAGRSLAGHAIEEIDPSDADEQQSRAAEAGQAGQAGMDPAKETK